MKPAAIVVLAILCCVSFFAYASRLGAAQGGILNFENKYFRVAINTTDTVELVELFHKQANENVLMEPSKTTLFEIKIADAAYTPDNFRIKDFKDENGGITFHLLPTDETVPVAVNVTFDRTEWDELSIKLAITNRTGEDIPEVVTAFPIIGGIRFGGTLADEMVFSPHAHGKLAQQLEESYVYGGGCYWQIVDLYNEDEGYGIYMRIDDSTGDYKKLELSKKDENNLFSFATRYCEKPLAAGATITYPAVVLGFHEGDWRNALDAYMTWLKTWYTRRPTPLWFKRAFLMRPETLHEYPEPDVWPYGYKNDSSFAFDRKTGEYRISQRYYEMLPIVKYDIFHFWRWWDGAWTWKRHGDYYFPPLRGGEEVFKEHISKLQENEDLKFTLYFEGYLLAKETYAGSEHGEKWSFKNKEGNFWSEYGDDYWKCCVSVPEWQDFLVEATTRIARKTGINGVYIDSIGAHSARLCYNPDHHHPNPGTFDQGMGKMFQKLRVALDKIDPDIALFTEATHSDYTSQFLDGALGQSMFWHAKEDEPYQMPAVNFFRFYFPDHKIFTIPSFAPTAELMMVELFNGNGMYVNYIPEDSIHFEDPNHLPRAISAIKKISEVYHENINPFSSDDVYPLVPTLIKGVYANRFSSAGKTIYTFQNTTPNDYEDKSLIELDAKPGYHYVDILRKRPVSSITEGGKVKVAINIRSNEFGAIAELPEILRFNEDDGSITLLKPASDVKIVASLIDEDGNVAGVVDAIGGAGTYAVKLLDCEGQLIDALVVHRE